MRSTMLAASTLAAALVLATGAAAAANDRPKNRGYVVGDGGVARLADGGQPTAEAAQPDQTAQADTASRQTPGQTGSSARAAAPIGVNEPGVNRISADDSRGITSVIRSAVTRNSGEGAQGGTPNRAGEER